MDGLHWSVFNARRENSHGYLKSLFLSTEYLKPSYRMCTTDQGVESNRRFIDVMLVQGLVFMYVWYPWWWWFFFWWIVVYSFGCCNSRSAYCFNHNYSIRSWLFTAENKGSTLELFLQRRWRQPASTVHWTFFCREDASKCVLSLHLPLLVTNIDTCRIGFIKRLHFLD
jgi:hypothetical protein